MVDSRECFALKGCFPKHEGGKNWVEVQVDYDSPVDQAWYLIFLHPGLGEKKPTTGRMLFGRGRRMARVRL